MASHNLSTYATRVARKYGIPIKLFLALGGAESGGSQSRGGKVVTSSAGAQGWGQLMPETARGLGVDPTNPYQNIEGAARYLSQQKKTFGSWRLALAAYNAGPGAVQKYGGVPPYRETQDYVAKILRNAGVLSAPTSGSAGTDLAPSTSSSGGAQDALQTPTPVGRGLPDLQEAARMGLEDLRSGDYDPTKALGDLAATAREVAPETPTPPEPAPGAYESADGFNDTDLTPADGKDDDWQRWVVRPSSVAGPSKPHGDEILQFVGRIGRRHGQALQPWPNESHSLTTVSGTPSAHGSGRAADIPAKGAKLRRLGYLALLEAGMPKKEALKAARKGGLYNVGGNQIIFATQIGGDHSDHLHVGIRG